MKTQRRYYAALRQNKSFMQFGRGRIDCPVKRMMTGVYCFGSTRQLFVVRLLSPAVALETDPFAIVG